MKRERVRLEPLRKALRPALGPAWRRMRRLWQPPPAPPSVAEQAAAPHLDADNRFGPESIEWVRGTYFRPGGGSTCAEWQPLAHAHMRLPSWFRQGLDPFSPEYAAQQERLWQLVAGVSEPYVAHLHEKEHELADVDPVRRPGYFIRRDPQAVEAASDHVIATGMLLRHSGLRPGDLALEYGPGFGQTALALARLGVRVDTVDISSTFCGYVQAQAEFFQVPLTAHHAAFGHNPRPGERYRLIWFYESFHHCVDFLAVVPRLVDMLDEGGRIVLGGEPIVEQQYDAVPYPWGLRLHSEVVAVVRQLRWFELGFSESFLFELFRRHGLVGRRIDCEPTLFGRLYVFERATPT